MSIHRDAYSNYFSSNTREMTIANALNEAFNITYGRKWGEQSFWIANPHQHVRERFGLDLEILVVYSEHDTTDARVFKLIENVTRSPDFKHRIDKVLFILIHSSNESDVTDLCSKDRDHIIVPFNSEKLLAGVLNPFFIRSEIAKHFGMFDLFGMSSPIQNDRYFFGRDELVNEISQRAIRHKQNSGLFGLRKTGKTSVLHAISRRTVTQNVFSVYIDCQNTSVYNSRWWQALERICDLMRMHFYDVYAKRISFKSDFDPSNSGVCFLENMKAIFRMSGCSRIVLMFDEIEYITPAISGYLARHWDQDYVPFWQTIRSVHQELHGDLTFVVAGVNPIATQSPNIGKSINPIFQLATPFFLRPLASDAFRSMIRTIGRYSGFKFEEKIYNWLYEKYGGHPYLTRIACSTVWNMYKNIDPENAIVIKLENFISAEVAINNNIKETIKDILLSLVWWYPDMFEVLQVLAMGDREAVDAYLTQSDVNKSLYYDWGILKEGFDGFNIGAMEQFINDDGENYKKVISPFSRGDFPMEDFYKIPDKEVLSELFEKKIDLEIKLRNSIMLYVGLTCSWNPAKISQQLVAALRGDPSIQHPDQLFLGREPRDVIQELFMSSLKYIILNSWDIFKNLFANKKELFEMNMDTVNIGRRYDSHSKYISKEESLSFLNSYDWLLNCVKDVPLS